MSTEAIIQNRFYYDFMQAFHVILPNVHIDNGCEMDLFCIRNSGYCEEFEIKLTASDFRADFKKTVGVESEYLTHLSENNSYRQHIDKSKHDVLQQGKLTANRFNFILPEELIEKVELPDYAGLYVYKTIGMEGHERQCILKRKQGKLLHKNKVTLEIYKDCCNKYQHRMWSARNKLAEKIS